jgi:hypothetical protein
MIMVPVTAMPYAAARWVEDLKPSTRKATKNASIQFTNGR